MADPDLICKVEKEDDVVCKIEKEDEIICKIEKTNDVVCKVEKEDFVVCKVEKEDEKYFTQQSEWGRKVKMNDPPKADLPVITSVFSLSVKQEEEPPLIDCFKSETIEQKIHPPESELSSEFRPVTRITNRHRYTAVSDVNWEPNSAKVSPLSSDSSQVTTVAALIWQGLSLAMDKTTIQNLIIRKSQRLSFIKNEGTSIVWKSFVVIYVDGQSSGFAMCKTCKAALKWRSRDGTSGLKAHIISCKQKCSRRRNIGDILHKVNQKDELARSTTVPPTVKAEVTNAVALMCAMDIRPFSTVEGIGFTHLVEKLISIGAKYGQLSADQVLPSARTVSRHISAIAEKEKAALSDVLRQQIKFGVTTDLWTEDGTRMPYITVTAQYVDENFHLNSRILATRTLLEKHTAANVRSIVKEILQEFGAYRQDNIYVTDSGANVKAAFKDQQWISCAGHNLNLVLVHGLKDDSGSDSPAAEISDLIKLSKDIITHVKHSRMQQKLETSLKHAVPTRWNGIYEMLVSICQNLTHLKQLATEFNDRKLQKLLLDLNEALLNDIICVLSAFEVATRVLSADQTPTICNVLPSRAQLLKYLTVTVTDSSIIAGIKEHFQHLLEAYFPVHPLHRVGSLLHPRLKNNPIIFPDDVKTQATESLRRLYQHLIEMEGSSPTSTTQDPPFPESVASVEEPPSKRKKMDVSSFLSDFYGTMSPSKAIVNELDSYLCSSDADDDVLTYWRNKQECWPKLAKLVRGILCIPATSTSSERTFSIAGRTVEERRARLNPAVVDDLLFIHGLKKS